jgi:hypothetical protein
MQSRIFTTSMPILPTLVSNGAAWKHSIPRHKKIAESLFQRKGACNENGNSRSAQQIYKIVPSKNRSRRYHNRAIE